MDSYFQSALHALRSSIHSRDEDTVVQVLTDLELRTVEAGHWPSLFFDNLIELLAEDSFTSLKNSWKLLYFINNNWEQLLPRDRASLRDVMVKVFDRYADWMGPFITCEILGEHYPDDETLAILSELAEAANLPARAAIPHALEILVRTAPQESLRHSALSQLQRLEKSSSEDVRREAMAALKKVSKPFPEK
jgi:hypothetical protein